MLDDDLISVARVIRAESFGIPGLNDTGNSFLQNVGLQRHVMVPDHVDELDAAVDQVVQLVNHAPVVGDHVLVELVLIRVSGIIDGQKPLVQEITGDHQFAHVFGVLKALQEINEQRKVFQRLGIAVLDTEVNVAYDDDLIFRTAGFPQGGAFRRFSFRCVYGGDERQGNHHAKRQQ